MDQLIKKICQYERIALDTEADSLHSYREKLCLIQLGFPDGCQEIVDPLTGHSLEPLYEALQERQVILHGADYDLRLLRRAGNFTASSIFDTAIAARLLGIREFGYAALVKAEFGIELVKASQKANWGRRPLTEKMLEYARNDTRYLHDLAKLLEKRLRDLSRFAWFEQTCERTIVTAAVDRDRTSAGLESWRLTGSGTWHGKALAVLREMWNWRDEEARLIDKPSFYILRNEDLLTTSLKITAGDVHPQFGHIKGPRLTRFLESAKRGLETPESEWPTRKRGVRGQHMTADQDKLAERLKELRDQRAAELSIEPAVIASRAAIEASAQYPEKISQNLMPWQREILGI